MCAPKGVDLIFYFQIPVTRVPPYTRAALSPLALAPIAAAPSLTFFCHNSDILLPHQCPVQCPVQCPPLVTRASLRSPHIPRGGIFPLTAAA